MKTKANSLPRNSWILRLQEKLTSTLCFTALPEDMPVKREILCIGFNVMLGSSSSILVHNLATLSGVL
jgi:hypothetical protein